MPFTRFIENDQGVEEQVDISLATMFVEIPAARVRKQLVIDPDNALGLRILLERSDIERIPEKPSQFAIVDESGIIPIVDWTGMIVRYGYKGDPSA